MPPKPTVLAFDTSAAHCAAALLKDGRITVSRIEEISRGQGERLMPLLEEVLAEGGIGWADLDRIGVGIGPGNFTGIRISVSAARGLALGLDIPAVGVSGLEALAEGQSNVITCLPAPRGRAYVQAFMVGVDPEPQLVELEFSQMPQYSGKAEPAVIGPNSADVGTVLHARSFEPKHPLAEGIAMIASYRDIVPGDRPSPLYLRPADAAPSKETGPVILP